MRAKRKNCETNHQFWNKSVRITADCIVDAMTAQETENALSGAAFTAGMNDESTVKAIWRIK